MLTREQILTLPAEQLAEVSARMMGFEIVSSLRACVVKHPEDKNLTVIWKPHTDHNDARWVADWVCKLDDDAESTQFEIYEGLQKVMHKEEIDIWNLLFHTPEQLTRASLLAFVDTSQGNLGGDVRLLANELDGGEI